MDNDLALIDTHCHLDFPVFDEDRDIILSQCLEQNITSIVVPGVCQKDWHRLLTICDEKQSLLPALGLHPCFINEHQMADLDKLTQLCHSQSLAAIGEIGLDFYDADLDRDKQGHYFSEQLQIAGQYQLPVLIHARKSHSEVIRYLKATQATNGPINGIIHAYSGSYEQAKEYLKLGFKLGFGGAYTYPKATKLRSLLPKLPLDAWVLETDAPDMSPVNHHGKRNSPYYLSEIARTFIALYDDEITADNILRQLKQNTRAVFQFL